MLLYGWQFPATRQDYTNLNNLTIGPLLIFYSLPSAVLGNNGLQQKRWELAAAIGILP